MLVFCCRDFRVICAVCTVRTAAETLPVSRSVHCEGPCVSAADGMKELVSRRVKNVGSGVDGVWLPIWGSHLGPLLSIASASF